MKSCNLCVMSFKVCEIEMIRKRLLLSGESEKQENIFFFIKATQSQSTYKKRGNKSSSRWRMPSEGQHNNVLMKGKNVCLVCILWPLGPLCDTSTQSIFCCRCPKMLAIFHSENYGAQLIALLFPLGETKNAASNTDNKEMQSQTLKPPLILFVV